MIILAMAWATAILHAEEPLLPANQAFALSSESVDRNTIALAWQMAPNYYLYQHKVTVQANQQDMALQFPKATRQHDETFGTTWVYFNQLHLNIKAKPNTVYDVSWQGCAKDRLCYPPQHTQFKTDADGLMVAENKIASQRSVFDQALSRQNDETTPQAIQPTSVVDTNHTATLQDTASDQHWASRLENHSLCYGLGLFLGLGLLLAFTPCSLPMLPIVSSLLIREHKGAKAWLIAGVFVLSMATVYALLGVLASYIGLGFQRWLQQPVTLMAFSGLFVLFALNLFGVFELQLPRFLTARLDKLQSSQQGGSYIGAAVMGTVSALLVGPCMTAPLAGALLFIAQTQSQWHGALLLFVLGLGMGIPLLLVSILGSKVLPKAGLWMNQIKVIFAFIMLGLAVYFLRPLLSVFWLHLLIQLLYVAFAVYALYAIYKYTLKLKVCYAVLLVAVAVAFCIQQMQYQPQTQTVASGMVWHVATDEQSFKEILGNAPKGQAVVIDVYADWCVACQPIEHGILKQASIQKALQPYYLIKLDLSKYNASQQNVLTQWQVLGPPTYLFLDASHQERRDLRLTGEFEQNKLQIQLAALAQ
ncbi:protein-disulfide reductase DsbD [Acinetobacter rathckeae]|uniref:protein-disulfide reductase DsbD n=1 Tax=Acinetobacter rathckeae TaxID=2605272 RepID=UPI001D183465|nr:protein-disulfide reductase DsbD [Acinetobacter rathckeae]